MRVALVLEINGRKLQVQGITVTKLYEREKCVRYSSKARCWKEYHIHTYVPQPLVPNDNEVLVLLKIPRDILERS